MIRVHAPHPAPYRLILLVGVALAAWWGTGGALAQAQRSNRPPSAAVARLTSLAFSPSEARCLLRATEVQPGTSAGAYAAQRIAMAVLYGNAHAFGSPGHHGPTAACAAFPSHRGHMTAG